MAKPPPDADPEKFVICSIGHHGGRNPGGPVTNMRVSRPYQDDHVFRINPIPTPVWSLVIINLILIALFYGFHWAFKHAEAGPWAVYGFPIGFGFVFCGALTAAICWTAANAQRLGPWLIYDKATGRVELPRQGVTFERQEIVHLQYITTKRLGCGGVSNNEALSQLNLITSRNGVRERWPVIGSTLDVNAFDHVLKPLVKSIDLPVMRVQDEWRGWRVTETPYGRTAGNE